MTRHIGETVSASSLAATGQRIYDQRLKAKLEARHRSKIAAIEAQKGDYFIGDTLHKASEKAKEEYPDCMFHFVRVGHPAVYHYSSIPTVFSVKA